MALKIKVDLDVVETGKFEKFQIRVYDFPDFLLSRIGKCTTEKAKYHKILSEKIY